MSGELSLEERRRRRLDQLDRAADELFAAEIRAAQAARWRERKLQEHVCKHRPDFERHFGRVLSPSAVEGLSMELLKNWGRIFTGLEPNGAVTYAFVSPLPASRAIMVVVTRKGLIRTLFVADQLTLWLGRHPELVEVTDRARRLGC